MKNRPYLIKTDRSGQALTPINPDHGLFSETWLQELLHNHPDILPVKEIEPVFWPLAPIGREIPIKTGFIDNLFISKEGYPVLVETKLWRNPEAKREVIAQSIDYASEFSNWTFDQLDRETRKSTQKGIIELIQTYFDLDQDELPSEDLISKNLRLGRFLILIVGDQIRSSLIGMLGFMNRFPHLASNVGLIEMQCFHFPEDNGEIIVVPSIVARTEIVERSIVQVSLTPDIAHHISVEQIKSEPDTTGRRALSEDAFWEKLAKNSPNSVPAAKQILEYFHQNSDIVFKMRETAIVARLDLPNSDQRLSLFFIDKNGLLECWSFVLISKLQEQGLDQQLGIDYVAQLQMILNQKRKEFSIYSPIENIEVDRLIPIVEDFVQKVLKAEAQFED